MQHEVLLQALESARQQQPRRARPFFTATFAVSADGCIAATRGRPSAISSDASLQLTHRLRAAHDAVLVGVGTVLADDPQLTTRLVDGPSPRRVVLDSKLRTPCDARLLTAAGPPPLILTTAAASPERAEALRHAGAQVLVTEAAALGVSLPAALKCLAQQGLASVMVEGGATVLDSFFDCGVVDFVVQTTAPLWLMGAQSLTLGVGTRAALARWAPMGFDAGPDRISLGRWMNE